MIMAIPVLRKGNRPPGSYKQARGCLDTSPTQKEQVAPKEQAPFLEACLPGETRRSKIQLSFYTLDSRRFDIELPDTERTIVTVCTIIMRNTSRHLRKASGMAILDIKDERDEYIGIKSALADAVRGLSHETKELIWNGFNKRVARRYGHGW